MNLIELVQNPRWLPKCMTYRPPDTPMHGGSQDYFTMQLCSENFDVDLAHVELGGGGVTQHCEILPEWFLAHFKKKKNFGDDPC